MVDPRTAVRIDRTVGRVIYRLHRWLYRLTGGAIGHQTSQGPMLLLTTKGRRSRQERTVPLLYMPHGECFVVVGSNGGRQAPPAWLLNLRADPEARVQVGRRRLAVHATILDGEAKSAIWRQLTEFYRGWAHYQTLTDRSIPAIVLEPVSG